MRYGTVPVCGWEDPICAHISRGSVAPNVGMSYIRYITCTVIESSTCFLALYEYMFGPVGRTRTGTYVSRFRVLSLLLMDAWHSRTNTFYYHLLTPGISRGSLLRCE